MTSMEILYQDEFSKNNERNSEKSEINILNKSEDDEMEAYGYTLNVYGSVIAWISIISSFGLLRLIFYWYPHWMLYMTYKKCPLKHAQKVLIVGNNSGGTKEYITEDVKTVSLDDVSLGDVRMNKCNELGVRDLNDPHVETNCRSAVRIYLNDGSYIDSNCFKMFQVKKIFYVWNDEKRCFVKIGGLDKGVKKEEFHAARGFSAQEQLMRRLIYGDNVIDIKLESITSLICSEILTPFYMFQICTVIIWLLKPYIIYAIAIVAMSVIGIGSSVFQTRQNQKKLHKTVHSVGKILVCRNSGQTKNDVCYEKIFTNCLVPGDVIVIPREGCVMPCDAVLISGNCIVNESMLTGESVPITKSSIPCHDLVFSEKEDVNHTLFCGTHILQARYYAQEYVHAVVIRTGFLTTKGSLVLSILYPVRHDFKFDQDIQKVVWFLSVVAVIGTIYSFILKTMENEDIFRRIIDSVDVITIIVPPALPAAMTVGKYYAIKRLREKNVSCINSSVINVAGLVNCVCFDKTGTLTEEGLDLYGIIPVTEEELKTVTVDLQHSSANQLKRAMASCHSLTIVNGEISGDPLDVKMFEWTNYILEEHEVTDSIKYDLLAPTVVKPSPDEVQQEPEIGLIHQFQFSSHLQRMSVITRHINSRNFTIYCKGSPEIIKSLCLLETIPINMESTLQKYATKGFRVIAMAYKTIPLVHVYELKNLHREEVENNLTFIGLILFENKLKPQTIPVINELKQARMKIFMLTGDNVQTAICVGKECNLINSTDTIIHINSTEADGFSVSKICYSISEDDFSATNSRMQNKATTEKCIFTFDAPLNYTDKLVLTGNTWRILKEHHPRLITKIISKTVIFARMSPDQKQEIIQELISIGHYVAMCGDGANDCSALRTSHVGISLSEMESSVASAFTSHRPDISCVSEVIREGRASLVTSFGLFKFMVLYSVLQFFSILLLYTINGMMSDYEFLYIDLCLIVVFGFFFGQSKAYSKRLVVVRPLAGLISTLPLVSMILQTVIMLSIQIAAFLLVRHFPWYQPLYDSGFLKNNNNSNNNNNVSNNIKLFNYENYSVYTISLFQYIILAVCYSYGAPYREPIYKNTYFFLSIIVLTIISAVITVSGLPVIETVMGFKCPPNYDLPVTIVCMAIANFVISMLIEDVLVNKLLFGLVYSGQSSRPHFSNSSRKSSAADSTQLGLSVEQLSESRVKYYGTISEFSSV